MTSGQRTTALVLVVVLGRVDEGWEVIDPPAPGGGLAAIALERLSCRLLACGRQFQAESLADRKPLSTSVQVRTKFRQLKQNCAQFHPLSHTHHHDLDRSPAAHGRGIPKVEVDALSLPHFNPGGPEVFGF